MRLYDTPEEAHGRAQERGARCEQCVYYGRRKGPVLTEINEGSKLIAIGSNPAKYEVRQRQPLVGPTGQEYEEGLKRGGLLRSEVSTGNIVACQPTEPGGRVSKNLKTSIAHWKRNIGEGFISPVECCRPMVERDIEESGAGVILTLGAEALDWVAKHYDIPIGKKAKAKKGRRLAKVGEQAGHPFPLPDGRILCPTMMPAYALSTARHLIEPIKDDIADAAAIARTGEIGFIDPEYKLWPSVDEVEAWCRRAIGRGLPLMIDLETGDVPGVNIRKDPITYSKRAPLRCVGIGQWRAAPDEDATIDDLRALADIIVVPVRYVNGSRYWSKSDGTRVKSALLHALDALPAEAQNAAFDSAVMLVKGLVSDPFKPWFDTAVAHHNTREHDCPHNLAFISKRFLRIPLWKVDVEWGHTESEELEE